MIEGEPHMLTGQIRSWRLFGRVVKRIIIGRLIGTAPTGILPHGPILHRQRQLIVSGYADIIVAHPQHF